MFAWFIFTKQKQNNQFVDIITADKRFSQEQTTLLHKPIKCKCIMANNQKCSTAMDELLLINTNNLLSQS